MKWRVMALRLVALSLMRSKSYLGTYLRRQRSRLGAPKAITATAYKGHLSDASGSGEWRDGIDNSE